MSQIFKGYELAVKHLRERYEAGETFTDALNGMEQTLEDNK